MTALYLVVVWALLDLRLASNHNKLMAFLGRRLPSPPAHPNDEATE